MQRKVYDKGDSGYYIVHLKAVAVTVLEYSAETAGQFDQYYSGAANALNEYDIEFDVGAIERPPCSCSDS